MSEIKFEVILLKGSGIAMRLITNMLIINKVYLIFSFMR